MANEWLRSYDLQLIKTMRNDDDSSTTGAWVWFVAACCVVALALSLFVCRSRTLFSSDSHVPLDRRDWRERMRAVRFRQQLAHWAAGNSAFRAGRRGSRMDDRDSTYDMV